MKSNRLLALLAVSLLVSGCNSTSNKKKNTSSKPSSTSMTSQSSSASSSSGSQSSSGSNPDPVKYVDKNIDVYRKVGQVDKQISLRYFENTPNVPYIRVKDYFKEFYSRDLILTKNGEDYNYSIFNGGFIGFDTKENVFYTMNLRQFNEHPGAKTSSGKLFISGDHVDRTPILEKRIDLDNYSIELYSDGNDAYAPLSFLSSFAGSMSQLDVLYNGEAIFVIDYGGILGEATTPEGFGETYTAPFKDTSSERKQDLAEYTYHELCFVFDNLRGYTEHLVYGDENLLTLGLDKLLDEHAPKTKQYLLSLDKMDYYEGLAALFYGLFDGGHTGIGVAFEEMNTAINRQSEEEFNYWRNIASERYMNVAYRQASAYSYRIQAFGSGSYNNFKKYDESTKTMYLVFSSFKVNYDGWHDYYDGKSTPPTDDTFYFVQSSLINAKEVGAENIVLDLTTNGGGDSYAYEGLVGLFNGAKSYIRNCDTVNDFDITEHNLIDVNLDGKFDNDDVTLANSFNFNVGVLTSAYSFSCGNLFPFVMKELGYKTLGEKTGGGSCAVAINSTADGLLYHNSSYICLTDKNGKNIDGGVEPDFPIAAPQIEGSLVYDYSNYFNFELVSNYLSNAY